MKAWTAKPQHGAYWPAHHEKPLLRQCSTYLRPQLIVKGGFSAITNCSCASQAEVRMLPPRQVLFLLMTF
jgi:hypothetical protein